ncbi:MAG: CRTAC1 family protein [Acidobacteria bacterium]|nr:MAG: CRTAC1 family protein [Acidobacteriota bacterium]REK00505.1 MAG: CRTAC1 family protein [Acidobacteriota bacterium]
MIGPLPHVASPGVVTLALGLCGSVAVSAAGAAPAEREAPCPIDLVEAQQVLGVDFVHRTGAQGEHHLPETMGSGVAWYDYDGDGWLDLYLVQSGPFPPTSGSGVEADAPGNQLFRNLGPGPDGVWRGFEEWSRRSGSGDRGYGQGVLPVDLDGDGRLDLVLANYGGDRLLRAQVDGTYRAEPLAELDDVAPAPPRWSSSIAAADPDDDGDLDLYVARYLDYDPGHGMLCGEADARRACDPALFEGQADGFWSNQAGTLTPRPLEALGLRPEGPHGKGLGVVWTDLDGDRRPDLYIANDLTVNLLFRTLEPQQGEPRFEELSLLSGAGVNAQGRPEAGMGVAAGDVDGDGDPELLVTNFDVETNTLYENLGGLEFEDRAAASGFGLPSFNRLGFGLVLADLDLDGWLDAYVANGHIFQQPARGNVGFEQPDQLLRGVPPGRFEEVLCAELGAPLVSRGGAAGDFDNDGRVDLAINNSGGAARILRNRTPAGGPSQPGGERSWVGIELRDESAPGNLQAIGARVSLHNVAPESGGVSGSGAVSTAHRWVSAGDSYQSASDRRQVFPLGAAASPAPTAVLEVDWPGRGAARQRIVLPAEARGRYLRVVRR